MHAGERLTVVTWNVEQGSRYDAILATLREQRADVILLQEVDRFCRRSGNRDVARDLAYALDMNWVSAGEFQDIGEARGEAAATTGQALLRAYPIENASVIVFGRQSGLRWRVNPVQVRRGGRIALRARSAGISSTTFTSKAAAPTRCATRSSGTCSATTHALRGRRR